MQKMILWDNWKLLIAKKRENGIYSGTDLLPELVGRIFLQHVSSTKCGVWLLLANGRIVQPTS